LSSVYKNANHSSPEEQTNATSTKEKQAENIAQQSASSTSSSRSGSISRTKSPTPTESTSNKSSDKPQPGHPGIRTRSITEEKSSQDDTKDNKSDETVSIISKPTVNIFVSFCILAQDQIEMMTSHKIHWEKKQS
jgi:hypothetical protein